MLNELFVTVKLVGVALGLGTPEDVQPSTTECMITEVQETEYTSICESVTHEGITFESEFTEDNVVSEDVLQEEDIVNVSVLENGERVVTPIYTMENFRVDKVENGIIEGHNVNDNIDKERIFFPFDKLKGAQNIEVGDEITVKYQVMYDEDEYLEITDVYKGVWK